MSEQISFVKFIQHVMDLPIYIGMNFILNQDARIPWLGGIKVNVHGDYDNPKKWSINLLEAQEMARRYQALPDYHLQNIQKIKEELKELDKVKPKLVVKRKSLVTRKGTYTYIGLVEKHGYQRDIHTIEPTTALITHVHDYETGKKLEQHIWCTPEVLPPTRKFVKFEGDICLYNSPGHDLCISLECSNFQILTKAEVIKWKGRIIESRKSKHL